MARNDNQRIKIQNLFDNIDTSNFESQWLIDFVEDRQNQPLTFWTDDEISSMRYQVENIFDIFDENHPDYLTVKKLKTLLE